MATWQRITVLGRIAGLLVLLAAISAPRAAAAMQAGVASIDITPKESIWLGGFASRTKPSQGIRQHIFAKALALRDETGATAVLVTADLLGFTGELTSAVAARAERNFQIPRRMLIFNASHTHSAPVIGNGLAPTYPLTDADRKVIQKYTAALEDQVVQLIGSAIENLSPAQLSFAQGLAGVAVNRRRAANPEYPDVIDPDVPVLTVRGENGALRAVVFGYACHNTTLDDYLVSGDWAGYAEAGLEARFPGAVALFVQGCGADANPLPRHTGRTGEALWQSDRRRGRGSGGRQGGNSGWADSGGIPGSESAAGEATLPRGIRAAYNHGQRIGTAACPPDAGVDGQGFLAGCASVAGQGWRIGKSFTFLALGGEVVADYALRFKREYGFRNLWVAGYSNDVFAYIPSHRVWLEGGYEGGGAMIAYGLPARFESSVEDLVVEAVHGLMKSLELP